MISFFRILCLSILISGTTQAGIHKKPPPQRAVPMVLIPGGSYAPLYSIDTAIVSTKPFYLDVYPVTNEQYYHFTTQNAEWQKGRVKSVFADAGYLRHWPDQISSADQLMRLKDKPVVNISWFAAKKYCECQGKRLPGVDEWEFVALASKSQPNGARDPDFYQEVLDWYSKPSDKELGDVRSTFKNYYGVYDMYGLVWEWVLDFNTALISGESRKDNALDKKLFCGGSSVGTADPSNYVAFMRYAMRASLKANYTVGNLGFRCAKNEAP